MTMIPITIAALFALVAADRVLLWCEKRGWIYYRRSRRMHHGAGNVLLDMEAFFQPSRRHVIELRQDAEIVREEDDESAPPPT